MLKYSAHHYDDFLRLKIAPELWFVLLFGVRHVVFYSFAILMPLEVSETPWVDLQSSPYLILADLPIALVLLATGHRIPDAHKIMRWIWHHGLALLLAGYLIGIVIFLVLNLAVIIDPSKNGFPPAVSVVLVDIGIMIYLIRSELIRDIFREFPAVIETKKGA